MQFTDLRLAAPLLEAIQASGYDTPTPIQAKAIPLILKGQDVLGCAQTGTGKTAAFALPMLQRLLPKHQESPEAIEKALREGKHRRKPRKRIIRGLVLCPTRELAMQIDDSFRTYAEKTDLRTAVLFGGVNQIRQVRALERGVDVVIATPGRLLDLLGQEHLFLDRVEMLVLDEADRMLDMGFMPDIRRIVKMVPDERQSLLFSATMPKPIRELADEMLNAPASIRIARVSSPAETVEQWVYHVKKEDRTALLQYLLEGNTARVLVFTRTKHGADRLVRVLSRGGIESGALHSNKTQSQRIRAMQGFRDGTTPVLIATDIAARGLDVDDVAMVVNFDLTPDPETYVHRIGRSGRAGAEGMAVSFCMPDQRDDLRAIEKLLRQSLQEAELPVLPKAKPRTSGKPDPAQQNAAGKAGKQATKKAGKKKDGPKNKKSGKPAPGKPTNPKSPKPGKPTNFKSAKPGKPTNAKSAKPAPGNRKSGKPAPGKSGKPATGKPTSGKPASKKSASPGKASHKKSGNPGKTGSKTRHGRPSNKKKTAAKQAPGSRGGKPKRSGPPSGGKRRR